MSTKTEREMLEWAAKAAGIEPFMKCGPNNEAVPAWNPLADDGDALRLAVTLNLMISLHESKEARCIWWREGVRGECVEPVDGDPYAATRRAIVRAAAEIGRSKHE